MYADLGQTINAFKSRAVFHKRDISQTPMREFLAHMKASSIKGNANIEEAAAAFYLTNHGFHLMESKFGGGEVLPARMAEAAAMHVSATTSLALRMLYYIVTISAEEAAYGSARNDRFFDFVESSTSKDARVWLEKIMGRSGRSGGVLGSEAMCGSATLGECIKATELCFRFAQWSHGFGGLPWAQIAETAGEVIRGTNSLELMVDKAFTLCHNNGAIFNKGHYFTHYRPDFYTLLDIQASGQIPGAIASKVNVGGLQSKSVAIFHEQFAKLFPDEFMIKYDASKVKNMESVRAKKAAAAMAKAHAFVSSGGGWAAGASSPAQNAPPKRACDDLFSESDLSNISGNRFKF